MASTGYKVEAAAFGAKVEAQEGTAETIAATEATMETSEVSVSEDIPFVRNGAISTSHAKFPGTASGPRVTEVDAMWALKGSGTAGTKPAIDGLLEAAGLLGVNDPGVSEIYKDTIHGAAITAAWIVAKDVTDGLEHIVHGARFRNLAFNLNAGVPPFMKGTLVGAWNTPTEVNLWGDVVYESTKAVANIGGAFLLDSQNLKYKECIITIENELAVRPIVVAGNTSGVFSVIITKQNIRCSMVIEAEDPATWDAWTEFKTNQTWAFALPIGAVAGNIINADAPKMQITGLKTGEGDGVLQHTLEMDATRSGNTAPYCFSLGFT